MRTIQELTALIDQARDKLEALRTELKDLVYARDVQIELAAMQKESISPAKAEAMKHVLQVQSIPSSAKVNGE